MSAVDEEENNGIFETDIDDIYAARGRTTSEGLF
jgi:hypothetical protein